MSTPTASVPFSRSVPVRHDVDVFVAGGGPAGLAAGVTAARQGASVFLAEGAACFGGMGTAAGLPMFCSPTDGVNTTSAGFGTDVYTRLIAAGGTAPETRGKPLSSSALYYNPEILKRVYDELAVESGLRFAFGTQFLEAAVENGHVTHVVCSAKSGLFAVRAKLFIDATGDGDLCARAGAPFEKGDARGEMQPPTLLSLWCDIDWEHATRAGHGIWQQERELGRAFKDKVFTTEDPHLPGMIPTGPHTAWGNVGHLFGVDGTDEESVTQALVRGRRLVLEYERFYKEYLAGYEKMQLLGTGALLGVRETRRILGDYVLCLDDFKRRAVFADEIGRFSYPVDLHATRPGQEAFEVSAKEFATLRYKPGENYGIPYRCLTPQRLDNVLVAGRCISCDRHIQGSVRVMPACFITGQAAGMAAAIAADQQIATRHVDPAELQRRLLRLGAYLPNAKPADVARPAADGVHALPPREQWSEVARKRRDAYAITPDAPMLRGEFGFYCIAAWKQQGMPADANEWGDYGRDVFLFEGSGDHKLGGLGWCEAAFAPAFPVKIIEDRGDTEVEQDSAGRYVLYFKGRRSGFMPEYVKHPVKDVRSWEENVKWRLNPATPERTVGLEARMAKARHAAARGEMICQSVIGGYMYLRSLFGPEDLLYAFYDQPELLHDCMRTWFALADSVVAAHQRHVTLDEIFFAEDICYNHGSLIAPDMMREFLLPYYQQLIANTRRRQLDPTRRLFVQVDTDGDCRPVIPVYMEGIGMDVMSPFEVASGCDVVEIGRQYPSLVMRGGIDKRVLAQGRPAIDAMLERILPAMRKRGGFLPMCDHGVPEEVPFRDYVYFRQRVAELSG